MNFVRIETDAAARLAVLNADAANIAKKIRALDTATKALGDHETAESLKSELAALKAEAIALAKHVTAVKSLIAAAKSCIASAVRDAQSCISATEAA